MATLYDYRDVVLYCTGPYSMSCYSFKKTNLVPVRPTYDYNFTCLVQNFELLLLEESISIRPIKMIEHGLRQLVCLICRNQMSHGRGDF